MAGDRRLGLGSLGEIPFDTRCMVWSLCLYVGTVEPFGYREKDSEGRLAENKEESPWVSLLLVSKAILAEAEQFLYRNIFCFNDTTCIDAFAESNRRAVGKHSLMRKVSVAFRWSDYREPADEKPLRDAYAEDFDILLRGGPEDNSRLFPWTSIHECSKAETLKIWTRKLERVMEVLHPKHFNIDLSESFCYPSKCCSLQMLAVRALRETMINHPDQSYTWTISGVTGESILPKAFRQRDCEQEAAGGVSAELCPATPHITLAGGLPGHDAMMKLIKCRELPDWAHALASAEFLKIPAW